MKKHATFMALGLTALTVGCGDGAREEAPSPSPASLQAAPSQDRPSEQELAATRTSAPVTAVPVKYVIAPDSAPHVRISAGVEAARPESPGLTGSDGPRRSPR
ncbi:hypothetical protein [Corallococcus terminator]|uniref:Uncharacterized protein n=1 Tax=Corallococcus terminator TaxID=2316733 RepID=A0A3A8I3F0_9BACT|nr:hypothetical protein [Corallococcus terminator]RKG77999.1 hypothetical protein D7V88_30325 [Corallococcus terminator]